MRIIALELLLVFVGWSARCDASPKQLTVVPTATASEGCGNADGPAVEFVFKVSDELPTITFKDTSVVNPTVVFGPPLVGNQELHVRVNGTLAEIRDLRPWQIRDPDAHGGLLAWVCPAGGFPCDHATIGTVSFTRIAGDIIDGKFVLLFQSTNLAKANFSAKLASRPRPFRCRG